MENFNLFPAWKQAIKTLLESGLTYGSILRKDDIAKLCDLVDPTTIAEKTEYDLQMLTYTQEIKRSLLQDSNMMLATNFDGTYRVIEPKDQTAFALEHGAKSITREIRRMTEGVQYVNLTMLDSDSRRQNMDARAKIKALAGMQSSRNQELLDLASSRF